MNDKTKKNIEILILYIIYLYLFNGLPSLVLKSISDILSILFTSLAVTGVKVVIISWVIIIVENIVNKLKLK